MFNILFGISITLNIILIVGIFLYFKIRVLGIKKVQKKFLDSLYCTDKEFDDMLNNL